MERDNQPFTILDDGEIESFSWGSVGSASVRINASGVQTADDIYYASYYFDPGTNTLNVSEPTLNKLPPSPVGKNMPNPPNIDVLDIAVWGSSPLQPPLRFAGPQSGRLTITFRQRTSISGPIGNATGP